MAKNAENPTASTPEWEWRRFEPLVMIAWGWFTNVLAVYVIGARLFLIYLYGWHKVQQEHLRILSMPRGRHWPVSNGDMIGDTGIHFLISLVVWLLLFMVTYPFVRLMLPKKRSN
jgi:hypothetical protein